MHPQNIFAVKEWKLPEILLVAGACFALAALGFLAAIFLQLHYAQSPGGNTTAINPADMMTIEEKHDVLETLDQANSNPYATKPAENQADPKDPHAAEKLRIMEQLNKQ